jgi:DNA-binding response OmpR family regulator
MAELPAIIAVINTNPDIVRMLRTAIEQAGFLVVVLHIESIKLGTSNVEVVLREHDPKVIVYDVAPPYDLNWMFLEHLRASALFDGRRFVLTSVNPARLRQIVGIEESVYEVVGQPEDIGEVVRAVREASRARPTR